VVDVRHDARAVAPPHPHEEPSGGLVIFRDFVVICATAIGFGHLLAQGLNSIIAGAAVPMALGYAVIVAFPAAIVARAVDHHGMLKAMAWGAGVSAPPTLLALASGPAGLLFLGVGAFGGAVVWALARLLSLPAQLAPSRIKVFVGYAATVLVGGLALAYLIAYFQPSRPIRQLPALEVTISSASDRADLIAILRRETAFDSELHVDDATERWQQLYAASDKDGRPAHSSTRSTINVGVWRGADDEDPVAQVNDRGHLGRAWVMFSDYEGSAKNDSARARLIAALRRRWPDARDIPVMPNGAYPLANDLVWTGRAYIVKAERTSAYAAD
jgi:hypothetical protein